MEARERLKRRTGSRLIPMERAFEGVRTVTLDELRRQTEKKP